MRKAVRPILEVLIGVVCLETALGILSPTISLQLAHRHEPAELIGLIGSAYFGGFLVGTLTCHRVIDRVGHIRSFSVFAAIATTATLLFLIFDQISVWVILRVIAGLCHRRAICRHRELAQRQGDQREPRPHLRHLYDGLLGGAAASARSPSTSATPTAHLLLTMAAIALVLSMIPLALTTIGNPEIGDREHFGMVKLYRSRPPASSPASARASPPRPSGACCPPIWPMSASRPASFPSSTAQHHRGPARPVSDRLSRRPFRAAPADAGHLASAAPPPPSASISWGSIPLPCWPG